MATPPRFIVPGRTIHLIIRAVSRQHRFVPTRKVVQSIEYLFWSFVAKYGISVHEMTWMSNHAHIVITDEKGVLPNFVRELNSLLSRQLNAIRGLKGTNIEKGYVDQEIVGEQSMVRTCAYALANPCAAGLVSSAAAWKGVTTVNREYGEEFEVRRPFAGMWKHKAHRCGAGVPNIDRKRAKADGTPRRTDNRDKPSKLPAVVTGVLVRPRIRLHRTDAELRAEIRSRTKVFEETAAEKRSKLGQKVLGWRKVVRARWNQVANSFECVFEQKRRLVSDSPEEGCAFLKRVSAFELRYQEQLDIYVRESPELSVFPLETWKMTTVYNSYYDPLPTQPC